MRRVTMLLVSVFVVALGAGVVAGMLASRLPASTTAVPSPGQSPLAVDLNLTPQQQEMMRGIWEDVVGVAHNCYDQAATLQKARDEDVDKLFSDKQLRDRYNEVTQRYQKKLNDLAAQRQEAFNQAVASTMKILNPEQQKKYEQILKDRVGHGTALWTGSAATQITP